MKYLTKIPIKYPGQCAACQKAHQIKKTGRIKIAFIIDQLGTGGTERQLKLLLDALNYDQFEPVLYLLRGGTEHAMRPEKAACRVLGIQSMASPKGLIKILSFALTLRQSRFHVVQTFFQDSALVGTLAGRLAGVRQIIVSVRDLLFWAEENATWPFQVSLNLSSQVLVNSGAVKQKVNELIKRKPIHVIYNGIETGDRFRQNSDSQARLKRELGLESHLPIVALVANCNRYVKRVDLLIEAIPAVIKKVPAHFIIVGDGGLRQGMENRVDQLNIRQWVTFLGIRTDVEHILSGADLALNTSDSEGFSNAVMEAMRAGLPVVASDVGGNSELIQDGKTGLLFKPGSANDLTEKIVFLLTHSDIADKLGKAARQSIISNFDIQTIVQQHANLYQSMVNAG
ncbi:MAG: glycosyltransferase [Thermodesulfobacteriota bacterium]|nr:glycosyltransferase [Thermodesulfobacteriota bacterium]